ncbi:hypothetical protein WG904_04600 [Pedobacter sp. Du54]|uniref:TolB family protein n=1 Tax=Pedobacter anseongensis TaxID=3133439 RepID=UPI0030A077D7
MKKLLFICLSIPLFLQAQQIQYAAKVLKYSSDLGGKLNSVKRILGKPDAFPQGGASANAWVSKDALGSAFVEVEFEKAQAVKQIAVFENLNAGCVTRIQVGNVSGKLHTVSKKTGGYARWITSLQTKGNPDRAYYFNKKRRKIEVAQNVESNADIEYFHLENLESNVKIVRIEFNFGLKPGQKQIDAIAISDSDEAIQPQVNLIAGADNLTAPNKLIYSPDRDYDLSAISIMDNNLYYTLSMYEKAGEIHAINLSNPTEIIDVTKKIRNDKKLNYILGFVPETKTMLMGSENKFRWDGDAVGFDFFQVNDGIYTYQKPLKITAYSNYGDYADAFLTKDGQRIIFGLESDLTQGGFDLYFTQPKDEVTYGILQNMGRSLNTAADETNPFLLSDNKTIIFSSNGYSGYGDFDLYVSTRLDDTWKNWSEPKNLGQKVNGPSFDTNPYYDEKTEMLYYVSFRDGVSVIHQIKIPMGQLTGTK